MIQHMNCEIWNVYDTVFTFFMAIDRDPCESGLVTWLSPIDCDTFLVHVNLPNLAAIFNYQGKYHKSHKQMYQYITFKKKKKNVPVHE